MDLPTYGLSGILASSDVQYESNDDDDDDDDTTSVSSAATTPTTNTSSVSSSYTPVDLTSPRAQIDSGAKATVTNTLSLLRDIKWYTKEFPSSVCIMVPPTENC
mgnify:CR=1 FL=1